MENEDEGIVNSHNCLEFSKWKIIAYLKKSSIEIPQI